MTRAAVFAPAKINLFLHVRGRRADGYHLLDSLVAFADIGDEIAVAPAERLSLNITGPFAEHLSGGPDNLVMRAAQLLAKTAGLTQGAAITLDKRLPVSSGIGGGSSDAAAAILALAKTWRVSADIATDQVIAALGADTPVCLRRRPTLIGGIGEILRDAPPLPPAFVVLVNPGVPLPTADVFRTFSGPIGGAPPLPAGWSTLEQLALGLNASDNVLTLAATARVPAIADVLAALRHQARCLIARLSGSGPTCFGLFENADAAAKAAWDIAKTQPKWWAAHGMLKSFPPEAA